MCGTAEYLPPEIIGQEDQDDKVDIWCLGVLLYEMIHKRTPFMGQNIQMLHFQQKRSNIEYKHDLNPQLKLIIERCLAFEASRRPTAEQLLASPVFDRFRRPGRNQEQARAEPERRLPPKQRVAHDNGSDFDRRLRELLIRDKPKSSYDQEYVSSSTKDVYSQFGKSPLQSHSNLIYGVQTHGRNHQGQRNNFQPIREVVQEERESYTRQHMPYRKNANPAERVLRYTVTNVTSVDHSRVQRSNSQTSIVSDIVRHSNEFESNISRTIYMDSRNERPKNSEFLKPPTYLYTQSSKVLFTPVVNISVNHQNPFTSINLYSSTLKSVTRSPLMNKVAEVKSKLFNPKTKIVLTHETNETPKKQKHSAASDIYDDRLYCKSPGFLSSSTMTASPSTISTTSKNLLNLTLSKLDNYGFSGCGVGYDKQRSNSLTNSVFASRRNTRTIWNKY